VKLTRETYTLLQVENNSATPSAKKCKTYEEETQTSRDKIVSGLVLGKKKVQVIP